MIILGIDPGPEKSWWVKWDTKEKRIIDKGVCLNAKIPLSYQNNIGMVAVEDIQCFGMPVGKDVFETAKAIGRFLEKAENEHTSITQVPRREIKLHFCDTTRAKDSNIRQAIIDRFGGKEKAIGNIKNPCVLYGVKKDLWSALALCLWYEDFHQKNK